MARLRLARRRRARLRPLCARARAQAQRRHARSTASIAALAAVAPPVLVAAVVFWLRWTPCIRCWASSWNVVVLYFLMGFRRFSHAFSAIVGGAAGGRPQRGAARARRVARRRRPRSSSSGEIAKLAIERGLVDAYRQVFATLFWFAVLPGPAGAVLYRAAVLLAEEWRGPVRGRRADAARAVARRVRRAGARAAAGCSTGCPVRLTALSFAIVGDFEDAVACWRTQAARWATQEGGEHDGVAARERRRRARRAARRPAAGAVGRARRAARARAGRSGRSPTCCRRRSGSSGARWCCGCC